VTVRSAAAPPCVSTFEHWQSGPEDQQFLNIGTGVDLTIRELAEEVTGAADYSPYTCKTFKWGRMDALLTLSSKGQLVIPARLRQLLGLQPGDRLALSLEADGLRLVPEDREKSSSARALIGCAEYQGPPLSLEQMDPALFA